MFTYDQIKNDENLIIKLLDDMKQSVIKNDWVKDDELIEVLVNDIRDQCRKKGKMIFYSGAIDETQDVLYLQKEFAKQKLDEYEKDNGEINDLIKKREALENYERDFLNMCDTTEAGYWNGENSFLIVDMDIIRDIIKNDDNIENHIKDEMSLSLFID